MKIKEKILDADGWVKKVKTLFILHLKNTSLVFCFIFLYPGSLKSSDKAVIY